MKGDRGWKGEAHYLLIKNGKGRILTFKQDHMALQPQRQRFSVSDYHKMRDAGILTADDRVELLQGEIIEMSPINSEHASTVDFLARELILQIGKKAIVRVQNPIRLSDYSEPEPDLVIARFTEDRYRAAHPSAEDVCLVIEVADSSLNQDRVLKYGLYAAAGIPEYWIINLADRQVEVFKRPANDEYASHNILLPPAHLIFESHRIVVPLSDLLE